ncbi:MAG: SAVED domain-containing protein [Deltaproteobacteria bacterium]|nr:SAVED domain-containing protein [Deltaproteobacteria bacterium]
MDISDLADLFQIAGAGVWAGKWLKVAWEGRKTEKADIAIVVNISRPITKDVQRFLEEQAIDAHVVRISNVKRFGPRTEEWKGAVAEFAKALRTIQERMGAKTFHIFLSAPSVITMAMGCVLGQDYKARLYHRFPDKETYVLVLKVPEDFPQ